MQQPTIKHHLTEESDPALAYARYSALHMGPLVRALIMLNTAGYVGLIFISSLVTSSHMSMALRLSPALLALPIAIAVARARNPRTLSLLTLLSLLVLEIGINLNGLGVTDGVAWVIPGSLMVPVALAAIWAWRWDFYAALVISVVGPMPLLLVGDATDAQILRFAGYMAVSFCLAVLLRDFMRRNLLEQLRLQQQLQLQATTDGLTGLLLRKRFFELAQRAIERARRDERPVCMLYLDADHFKQLNDQYGHAAGDEALVALANCLLGNVRGDDLIGRVGGEEFAVLLPGLNQQQGQVRAEQLRMAAHDVLRPDGPLTISIGIAELMPDEELEPLLARADKAMRQAKKSGRDKVVTAADCVVTQASA